MIFLWFLSAALASFVLTYFVRYLALRFNIVDRPSVGRKIHTTTMPLAGGVGVYIAFAAVTLFACFSGKIIGAITWPMILGVLVAGALLVIGGVIDDAKNLPPKIQILFPIAAALIVVIGGVNVAKLTNPLGGMLLLAAPLSGLVVFPYVLATSYVTKLFDGLDGLVSGVTMIGAIFVCVLALTPKYFQPDVAILAAIAAGAFAGFLPWNFHPAQIFLGEGGSLFAGFILGVLSVISGAKIAVILMALGVAITDAAWVIIRRVFWEKKSFAAGDRKHLHFRLLDAGFSQRQAVLTLWFISAAFGASALLLQSRGKVFVFVILSLTTLALGWAAIINRKKI
jgi:UDP-GlcNAc:undecaprenyl-phosphate/decaprenyl-phosphate GlcNAc-1-phosphate transferase